jgi:hypothetical protein
MLEYCRRCWNILRYGNEKVVTLNAGQNHNIKIANRPFENVAKFKHLGTVTNHQNLIHEEIKRLSSKNENENVQNCNFAYSFTWV